MRWRTDESDCAPNRYAPVRPCGYRCQFLSAVHYVHFVEKTTGKFYDWFAGKNALIEQAQRQIVASEGAPIKWFFAEEESMEAFKSLLSGNGIEGIEFVFEPLK